jgi:hypothetical protein
MDPIGQILPFPPIAHPVSPSLETAHDFPHLPSRPIGNRSILSLFPKSSSPVPPLFPRSSRLRYVGIAHRKTSSAAAKSSSCHRLRAQEALVPSYFPFPLSCAPSQTNSVIFPAVNRMQQRRPKSTTPRDLRPPLVVVPGRGRGRRPLLRLRLTEPHPVNHLLVTQYRGTALAVDSSAVGDSPSMLSPVSLHPVV